MYSNYIGSIAIRSLSLFLGFSLSFIIILFLQIIHSFIHFCIQLLYLATYNISKNKTSKLSSKS